MPLPLDARKKIREKLDTGVLPRDVPPKRFASYGSGEPCQGCDAVIVRTEIMHEFDMGDGRLVSFHVGCAGLWEAFRRAV